MMGYHTQESYSDMDEDPLLPYGWEEHLDPSTGAVFYHNSFTKETQWDRPQEEASVVSVHSPDDILNKIPQRNHVVPKLEPLQVGHHHPVEHTAYPYPHHQVTSPAHYNHPPLQYPQNYDYQGYQPQQPSPLQYHYTQQSYCQKGYQYQDQQYHQQDYQPDQYYNHQGQPHTHDLQRIPSRQLVRTSSGHKSRRTTVKVNPKKLATLIRRNSKIHIQDDPATQNIAESSSHSSSDTKRNETENLKKDIPIGGKSQDYLAMAKAYKIQRPFLDRDHNIKCVLCHNVVPEDIFFPCEHKVVCRGCIKKEQVCPDYEMEKYPHGHCNCPLCASIIKLILPNENGKEVEKYWEWVLAVRPELPSGFKRDFRHSAAIIQKIHIDENKKKRKKKNKKACCVIS